MTNSEKSLGLPCSTTSYTSQYLLLIKYNTKHTENIVSYFSDSNLKSWLVPSILLLYLSTRGSHMLDKISPRLTDWEFSFKEREFSVYNILHAKNGCKLLNLKLFLHVCIFAGLRWCVTDSYCITYTRNSFWILQSLKQLGKGMRDSKY